MMTKVEMANMILEFRDTPNDNKSFRYLYNMLKEDLEKVYFRERSNYYEKRKLQRQKTI